LQANEHNNNSNNMDWDLLNADGVALGGKECSAGACKDPAEIEDFTVRVFISRLINVD
jgi:hypothetical protein